MNIKPIDSLMKYPGGKSNEIKYIKNLIPKTYDRYIEPFFGGGSLYLYLKPKKSIINDITIELTMFYSLLKEGEERIQFKKELECYVKYWNNLDIFIKEFNDLLTILYKKYNNNEFNDYNISIEIKNIFLSKIYIFNELFEENFCINKQDMFNKIQNIVVSKFKRLNHTNTKDINYISFKIETAFKSGFYMHFRDIMNKSKRGEIKISNVKNIANYYFIREYCYSSMFRYNEFGDFNIPYGGYNQKTLDKRLITLFSNDVKELFNKTIIENMDFESVLNKHNPTENDFIFFDPPYDSNFSTYSNNKFTEQDQERLSRLIYNLKSKFIMIIKETPLILNLYDNENFKNKGIKIESFEKIYLFNIEGRNKRNVKHLIIHNIKNKPTKSKSLFDFQ